MVYSFLFAVVYGYGRLCIVAGSTSQNDWGRGRRHIQNGPGNDYFRLRGFRLYFQRRHMVFLRWSIIGFPYNDFCFIFPCVAKFFCYF